MNKIIFNCISSELSHAGEATVVSPALLQLDKSRITLSRELPAIDFLYRMYGIPCFPRGELCIIGGKAKSGKTLYSTMLMAAGITPRGDGENALHPQLRRHRDEPLHVLWYDTEQSEQSTQEIMRERIGPLSEAMDVFNVRGVPWQQRSELLTEAVRCYQPDLVILDGVRDLVADINDGVKAQEVVENLMTLAQEVNCCIVCVLHQNKSAEDRNLRGWIGTELMNKAFEVYSCEKLMPECVFAVEQTHTRKHDISQLLYFSVGDNQQPVAAEAPDRTSSSQTFRPPYQREQQRPLAPLNTEYLLPYTDGRPRVNLRKLFHDVLKTGPLPYVDLQAQAMTLLNCQDIGFWTSAFMMAKSEGLIEKIFTPQGRSVWRLTPPKPAVPIQTELYANDATANAISSNNFVNTERSPTAQYGNQNFVHQQTEVQPGQVPMTSAVSSAPTAQVAPAVPKAQVAPTAATMPTATGVQSAPTASTAQATAPFVAPVSSNSQNAPVSMPPSTYDSPDQSSGPKWPAGTRDAPPF